MREKKMRGGKERERKKEHLLGHFQDNEHLEWSTTVLSPEPITHSDRRKRRERKLVSFSMPSSAAAMKSMDLDSEMDTRRWSKLRHICARGPWLLLRGFVVSGSLFFLPPSFINLPFHEVELKTGSASLRERTCFHDQTTSYSRSGIRRRRRRRK